MGTYYDGYGNIPNYGGSGERHEGDNLDHRVVDRNDVVANDWVGNRYGTVGSTYAGGAYAGPARQGGREAVMPETLKRRRLEADAPPPEPPGEVGPPGYVPSPSVAALQGLGKSLLTVGPRFNNSGPDRDSSMDWRCPNCANVNYSGRKVCNRCKEPLPHDDVVYRAGKG